MDPALLVALMLVLGLALGATLGISIYAMELGRMARFLRERGGERQSNARMTVSAPAPALRDLADAVNTELERSAEERIVALRRQREFQRGLSALSHDIRTPLTGAKGYLQLAAGEADGPARDGHLDAASARIDATCVLLDQLFAYTTASDPDLALERESVEVRPLIENVLVGHYPEFEARGWEPVLRFERAAPALMGDRDAIARIFENLVTNAIRYGAAAPVIEMRGRAVTFSNRVVDPEAIDAERLFDRFYRADASRDARGTGLGLSTAEKLARAMGMEFTASLARDVLTIELAAAQRPPGP